MAANVVPDASEWMRGRWRAASVRVGVPATCANLGSGFDCLALALDLRNTFAVTLDAPDGAEDSTVELRGHTRDTVLLAADDPASRSPRNLFLRAFEAVCARAGVPAPRLRVVADVAIPPARGLGSSATAVVGGIVAANALLAHPLPDGDLLELAVACEPGNHPDNVAAALLGGIVVTGARDAADHLMSVTLRPPPDLRAVLFIPDQPMSTLRGRALLPETYSRADVTYNLSRVALLVAAFTAGRPDLLAVAMQDRLHQPYRAALFPALDPLIRAALAAGAYGACLSGGGSSVLALALAGDDAEDVCTALQTAAEKLGVPGRGMVVRISPRGAAAEDPAIASREVTT